MRECARSLLLLVAASLMLLSGGFTRAAETLGEYPLRPVRLVNPFPPGGSSDPMCRTLGEALTRSLGQQFVVDNRGGSNGNIGTAIVAKANADGYTLLFAAGSTFTINPFVYASLPFNYAKDFTPIGLFSSVPNVLVVNPSLPVNTLKEFTDYVKNRPGQVNFASAGNGSTMHLASELFQKMTGTTMQHVPYVSPGQASQDTIANRTQLIFHLVAAVAPFVQAGRLRAITVLAPVRSGVLPDVPTTRESGLPGLESAAWYVVVAPKGSPRAVVAKLNEEMNRALKDEAFRKRIVVMGGSPLGGTPADADAMVAAEVAKWSEIVRLAGIKLGQLQQRRAKLL